MYRLNLFMLSEIANNSNSACMSEWTKYWIFDDSYNYGSEIKIQIIEHNEWLDDMIANCEEYLPYEEDCFDPEGFQPLSEEDYIKLLDDDDVPF